MIFSMAIDGKCLFLAMEFLNFLEFTAETTKLHYQSVSTNTLWLQPFPIDSLHTPSTSSQYLLTLSWTTLRNPFDWKAGGWQPDDRLSKQSFSINSIVYKFSSWKKIANTVHSVDHNCNESRWALRMNKTKGGLKREFNNEVLLNQYLCWHHVKHRELSRFIYLQYSNLG